MDIGDILNKATEAQSDAQMHEKRKKLEEERQAQHRKDCYAKLDDELKQIQHDFKDFIDVKLKPHTSYSNNSGYRVHKRTFSHDRFNPRFGEGKYGSDDTFQSDDKTSFCGNVVFANNSSYWRSEMKLQIQLDSESKRIKYLFHTKFYSFEDAEQYLDLPENKVWTNEPLKEHSRTFFSYKDFKDHLTDFLPSIICIDSFKEKHGIFTEEVEKVTRIG